MPRHNYCDGVTWLLRSLKPPATRLFVKHVQANNKSIEAPHYWPFVRGIHRWPMDSPHKRPVMRKSFPRHDLVMLPGIDLRTFQRARRLKRQEIPDSHVVLLKKAMRLKTWYARNLSNWSEITGHIIFLSLHIKHADRFYRHTCNKHICFIITYYIIEVHVRKKNMHICNVLRTFSVMSRFWYQPTSNYINSLRPGLSPRLGVIQHTNIRDILRQDYITKIRAYWTSVRLT